MKLNTVALTAVAAKALSCADNGQVVKYALGKGGFLPLYKYPTMTNTCDCSGFASWCLGLSRIPKLSRPWWLETTNIYRNALRLDGRKQAFVRILRPVEGCLAVYPDSDTHQGHVGVVTKVVYDNKGEIETLHGVDCSMSGWRAFESAIQHRDGTNILGSFKFFLKQECIFVVLAEHVLDSKWNSQ